MTLLELLQKHVDAAEATQIIEAMKAAKLYVTDEEHSADRYAKLQEKYNLKEKEHQEANTLIKELEKAAGDKAATAEKLAAYEAKAADLQAEKTALELDHAIKFELLAKGAKPDDLDYLMFKVKQSDSEPSLNDKGKLKGFNVKEVQTAYPNHFTQSSQKKVDENKLPKGEPGDNTLTKEQLNNMGYLDQLKVKRSDPDLYRKLTQ